MKKIYKIEMEYRPKVIYDINKELKKTFYVLSEQIEEAIKKVKIEEYEIVLIKEIIKGAIV